MLPGNYVDRLEVFYEYLIRCIDFTKKGSMQNPWPHPRKVGKVLSKLYDDRLYDPVLIDAVYQIRSRLGMRRRVFNNTVHRVKESNHQFVWAATVVAHAIGARNRYKCVQRSLVLQGVKVTSAQIKMSVSRFESRCAGFLRTFEWSRWQLQDLFNDFKNMQPPRKGRPQLIHEAENGAFVILNQTEMEMIKALASQKNTRAPNRSRKAHERMTRAYSTIISFHS